MKTKELRGITWVERWVWYFWLPAVLTVVLVCWGLTALHLAIATTKLGWFLLGLASAIPGTLIGVGFRRICFGLAEIAGPWIIVEALERPKTPLTGTGYAGYLCRTAGVTPGKVYATAPEVNKAHSVLCEVHESLMQPILKEAVRGGSLKGIDDEQWDHVVNHWGHAANGRPAPFYILPYCE